MLGEDSAPAILFFFSELDLYVGYSALGGNSLQSLLPFSPLNSFTKRRENVHIASVGDPI